MENSLFLIINSILNKKIFYADEDSLVQQCLNELYLLYLNYNKEDMLSFFNVEENKNILFNSEEVKLLKELLNLDIIEPLLFLKDFNLTENELLENYTPIIPINNNLPFNSFSSLIIDKKFLKGIDLEDHYEVRKSLIPIVQIIQTYKNQSLFLPSLNIEFAYNHEENKNSGYCSNHKIYVYCNALNSSSFHHEYFHALDKQLNQCSLNIKVNKNIITYSELSINSANLNEFNQFINNFDKNISTSLESKNNLHLYFNHYFSEDFNKIAINELTEEQLNNEIEKFSYGIYTNGKGRNKYQERDNIIKELQEHINYAFHYGQEPQRNLFSILSEAKDLGSSEIYFSKNAEKLARIYQSQFHFIKDNKIFPLGSEKLLVNQLNNIIKSEFKTVLKLGERNINDIKNIHINILKLREFSNKTILKR